MTDEGVSTSGVLFLVEVHLGRLTKGSRVEHRDTGPPPPIPALGPLCCDLEPSRNLNQTSRVSSVLGGGAPGSAHQGLRVEVRREGVQG